MEKNNKPEINPEEKKVVQATSKPAKSFDGKAFLGKILHSQMLIPVAAMLALLIFNLINDPSFFAIKYGPNSVGDNVFTGNLITILDKGAELAILAIGMTLVTAACGGQDISVGATIAIAGSAILRVVRGSEISPDTLQNPLILGFLVGCLAVIACGAFNGILVAYFKIQPMVATLILFTAGRSIAAWINQNQLPNIKDPAFGYYGGFIPGIPFATPILISIICFIIIALVLRFTTLGLYAQSVGINEQSSRLNGINPTLIKFITFVILGLCVAVCGLIKVSRISTINYSSVAKDIEMDAILAVALGGNALGGGKFSIKASVLGAYVIQLLTTTLYAKKVNSAAISAYKAVVVIILVVISAPIVREMFAKLKVKLVQKKAQSGKKVA